MPVLHRIGLQAAVVAGALVLATGADARVYWASHSHLSWEDSMIGVGKLDGRVITRELVSVVDDFRDNTLDWVTGLATDRTHVYWTINHHIGRARLDGSRVEPRWITVDGYPRELAVNAHGVYWFSQSESGATSAISRANLDGSRVDERFIPARNGAGLAVDAEHVYWSNGASVGRADLDGSNVEPRFIPSVPARTLAVNSSHIFWINDIHGISRAKIDGSDVQLYNYIYIERTQVQPWDQLAADSNYVYWAARDSRAIGRAKLDRSEVQPSFITTGPLTLGLAVDARTAPQTQITRRSYSPSLRRYSFEFASDEPRTTFECKIGSRAFAPCPSPKRYIIRKPGLYTFYVRAVGVFGDVDPTPARYRFRVR